MAYSLGKEPSDVGSEPVGGGGIRGCMLYVNSYSIQFFRVKNLMMATVGRNM